jgi:hypothetical protein
MVETVNTHKARYWRESDVWEVELVDDERVHTFASTLGRARRYIREATAAMYDLDVDQVDIDDVIELPGRLRRRVDRVIHRRAELDRTASQVAEETAEVVGDLIRSGVSVRDAADIVHLSSARVHQLARTLQEV